MKKQEISRKNIIIITLISLLFAAVAISGDLLLKAKTASAGQNAGTFSLNMPQKAHKGLRLEAKRLYAVPERLILSRAGNASESVSEQAAVSEEMPLLNEASYDVLADSGKTLSDAQIADYLGMLDPGTDEERKSLISFALSSVGRIPYYWGGKANGPGYQENRFGAQAEPDRLGRTKKGLDCSGWISWVYYSVTGSRTPGETTQTLVQSGEEISKEELLPGDVVIRTGEKAHALMFLGWAQDDRMVYIHETGGNINNVEVVTESVDYPYFRSYLS